MIIDRTKGSQPRPGWRGKLAFFVRWALVRYTVYAALFIVDQILRPGRSLGWQALGYALFEGIVVFAWLCDVAYRARREQDERQRSAHGNLASQCHRSTLPEPELAASTITNLRDLARERCPA